MKVVSVLVLAIMVGGIAGRADAASCSSTAKACAAASKARGQKTGNCDSTKVSCLQTRGSDGKCTWDATWTGTNGRLVRGLDCQ